jgi:hypothetical protein
MPPSGAKRLVALALMTAIQLLLPKLSPAQKATVGAAIEMRTDAEGVNFGPFKQSVYLSVKGESVCNDAFLCRKWGQRSSLDSIPGPAEWKSTFRFHENNFQFRQERIR